MPYTVPHLCMVMFPLSFVFSPRKNLWLFFPFSAFLTGLTLHLTEAAQNPKCRPKRLETAIIADQMRKDGKEFLMGAC